MWIEKEAAQARENAQYELGLWVAHHAEAFARMKRLPDWKRLLEKLKPKPDAPKGTPWRALKDRMARKPPEPPPRKRKRQP